MSLYGRESEPCSVVLLTCFIKFLPDSK